MKLRYLLLIASVLAAPWIINGYKFASCDFKSDYKCEIIHGAGVFILPASYITVWFGSDT